MMQIHEYPVRNGLNKNCSENHGFIWNIWENILVRADFGLLL